MAIIRKYPWRLRSERTGYVMRARPTPNERRQIAMPQNSFSTQPFEGTRVRFESTRSFDEVLLNLRKLVGTATPQQVAQWPVVSTREQFEKAIQSQVGESDFMLFLEIDHGEWLPVFGIQRKVVRWILGNPLLAITMMRHDITAGLFAPVELLLVENGSGDGSTVIYDLPSSLMAVERNPALRDAAHVLDRKLQTLVSRVTGVELQA
jgi:uncharacterized protein (DUF302 family)